MSRRSGSPSSGLLRRAALRPWHPSPFQVRVLVALDAAPATVPALASQLHAAERTVWIACAALLEHGRIVSEGGVVRSRR